MSNNKVTIINVVGDGGVNTQSFIGDILENLPAEFLAGRTTYDSMITLLMSYCNNDADKEAIYEKMGEIYHILANSKEEVVDDVLVLSVTAIANEYVKSHKNMYPAEINNKILNFLKASGISTKNQNKISIKRSQLIDLLND